MNILSARQKFFREIELHSFFFIIIGAKKTREIQEYNSISRYFFASDL